MHIVAAGWIFVTLMVALAEATSLEGSVLGALFTFALYGLLPLAIVLYVMGTPARRRARRLAEQAQGEAAKRAEQAAAAANDSAAAAPE